MVNELFAQCYLLKVRNQTVTVQSGDKRIVRWFRVCVIRFSYRQKEKKYLVTFIAFEDGVVQDDCEFEDLKVSL